MGAPSEYVMDFFTKLLLGEESVWAEYAYKPYILHQTIVDNAGKSPKDFSSKLDPNYAVSLFTSVLSLKADKLVSEDGQEFELSVPAYGARVVALDMTEKEREKLDEDPAVSISARNGEELVLLKSLSKETTTQQGANISAPAFRKTLEDKYRYLLLVVNTTNKKKDTHLKVASCEGLPLDEIIGTYDINYETSASVTINNYIARDGDSLVLSDSDGFNEPATLSYDPLKGIAYGKHTYSKVYATGVNEITVTYKLYFTRENGGITMTGVGSQTINGNPAGSWSYNETKIN